jgi:multiple sugar transport system substrate-binding protein
VMFYNAAWLDRLKAAAPPQNWTDFRKLCNAARDKKAPTWGYAHPAQSVGWSTDPAHNAGWSTDNTAGLTLINWISSVGGVLFDPRAGQVTLNDPQAVAALSVLRDLLRDDCAYCSSEPGADRADFAAQTVLFTFGSTADLPKYTEAIYNTKTKKMNFSWDIAPMPYLGSEPIVSVQGPVMTILHTTPRQQLAAWLFLKWFVGRENDVQWALETGALPLHKSSAETPEMQAYLEQNPQYETACGLLAFATTEPAIPKWQEIRALLVNAADAVCLGQAEPADALAAADTAADGLLAR